MTGRLSRATERILTRVEAAIGPDTEALVDTDHQLTPLLLSGYDLELEDVGVVRQSLATAHTEVILRIYHAAGSISEEQLTAVGRSLFTYGLAIGEADGDLRHAAVPPVADERDGFGAIDTGLGDPLEDTDHPILRERHQLERRQLEERQRREREALEADG